MRQYLLLLQAGVKNCLKNSNAMVSSIFFSWPIISFGVVTGMYYVLSCGHNVIIGCPFSLGETLWDGEWDPNLQLWLIVNTMQPHSLLREHHS